MKKKYFFNKEQLEELYKIKNILQLANYFGCDGIVIKRALLKFNIPLKSLIEANSLRPKRESKKYTCLDCDIIKSKCGKRCRICAGIFLSKINSLKPKKLFFCINCPNQISGQSLRCHTCAMKNRIGKKLGKEHHAWIDGRSFLPYPPEFNKFLKARIRQRDNYICQNCSMTEEEHLIVYGCNLNVHHIDYEKQNCNEDNLITVCNPCNLRANYNRNYWQEFYKKKVCTI